MSTSRRVRTGVGCGRAPGNAAVRAKRRELFTHNDADYGDGPEQLELDIRVSDTP